MKAALRYKIRLERMDDERPVCKEGPFSSRYRRLLKIFISHLDLTSASSEDLHQPPRPYIGVPVGWEPNIFHQRQVEIVVFIYKTFLGIKCLPSVQYKQNYVKISINFTLDTIPKGLQVATK
jgi:hypothetical protein